MSHNTTSFILSRPGNLGDMGNMGDVVVLGLNEEPPDRPDCTMGFLKDMGDLGGLVLPNSQISYIAQIALAI